MWICTYIHAVRVSDERVCEFERKQGVQERVWKEEKDGRKVVIVL